MLLKQFITTLDLTAYERAIILVLASVHEASAHHIYKESHVPQGRLYGVLNDLEKKGIVTIIPTVPKTYTITNISGVLEKYLLKQKVAIDHKVQMIKELAYVPKKFSFTKNASVLIFRGVEKKLEAIESLYDQSRTQVLRCAPLFNRSFFSTPELKLNPKRLRLIVGGITKENEKTVTALKNRGVAIRSLPKNRLSLVIVDGTHLLFDAQEYKEEERLTIYSKNTALIASFKATFETLWLEGEKIS